MTPSGSRVTQLQHKAVFDRKCERCLLCDIFGVRSNSGTTTTPQGFDMSLLWVPKGHVRSRGLFWTAPLPNAGQLTTLYCVTLVNSRISMINFHPRPRHTRERDRSLNPHSIVLGPTFRLQVRLALRLRATPVVYRSIAGFSIII